MKKKIFFIMSTNDYSGAENVNFSIIEGLRNEYDFYWVSRKGNINNYLKERNIKWIEIEELNIKEVKRIIKEFSPDVLHATDYKASVICSLANKNKNIKLIEHVHNNSPWLKKFCINSIAFLYAGLRADKILTVSKSIEKEYIFSKLISQKIECINNPVSRNKILKMVCEEDYEKKYDICCVARITESKNPFKFIEIINDIKKQIPEIKAIWVGDGELKKSVEEKVKKLKLVENIEFVGFQKNPYKYMAHSKIFMLTSDWEGYGLVVFEALTLGLPCIVSNVGGLPDIVEKKCGLCSNNKKEMENLVICLLNNENLFKEYKCNAIEKSKTLDNNINYMKKIKKVYGDTNE